MKFRSNDVAAFGFVAVFGVLRGRVSRTCTLNQNIGKVLASYFNSSMTSVGPNTLISYI